MSSSEQYAFDSYIDSSQQQQQVDHTNLLPSEFQWQPIGTTGGTTAPVDATGQYTTTDTTGQYTTTDTTGQYTTDTGIGNGTYTPTDSTYTVPAQTTTDQSGGGIVPNNSGIVDGSGQYIPMPTDTGTGMPPDATNPNGGYVDQNGQWHAPYGADGTAVQNLPPMDGTTGQPQYVIVTDPSTGQQYVVDATTGQPVQLDPATGQPIQPGGQGNIPMPGADGQAPVPGQVPGADGTNTGGAPPPTGDSSAATNDGGGGLDAWWLGDRAGSLLATGYVGMKHIPNFLPEGTAPSLSAIRGIPKEGWQNAVSSDLGKKIGGAWIGNTLLDATVLGGYDTSWKTIAVDVATPFLVQRFLPGWGLGKTLVATMGVHAAEKVLFEGKKEE